MGEITTAIQLFQKAIAREEQFPQLKTEAWSRYALLVATKHLRQFYGDVSKVLDDHKQNAGLLPANEFVWSAANALIAEDQKNLRVTREHATRAQHFAELHQSGLRYHPNAGLVGTEHGNLKARLRQILD